MREQADDGMASERERAAQPDPRPLKQAAVLLVLAARDGEPHVLFTRRTDRVADHKGQVSFPGGSQDPDDPDLLATALREAQEELGIDPAALRVLGQLSPVYTVVTRYVIAPFVAYLPGRPELRPDAFEVAEVFDVPVAAFLDPAVRSVETWDSHGVPREVYFYRPGERVIWGATARILKQFLDGYTPEWWRAVLRGEVAYVAPAAEPPAPA